MDFADTFGTSTGPSLPGDHRLQDGDPPTTTLAYLETLSWFVAAPS